jgi:6-phosphofructokinase 1
VQRGGTPSSYDRILGARMGCEAVLALMMHPQNGRPVVIGINGNQTFYIPLEESVEKTRAISKAISDKDFARAIELRGPSFKRNLETYLRMSKLEAPSSIQPLLPSTVKEVKEIEPNRIIYINVYKCMF